MTTPSRGTVLVNGVHLTGDPDGSLRTELFDKYEARLMKQYQKALQRSPALKGKISASDILQSVFARLKKAKNFREVKRGTAVLVSKGKKRIWHHSREGLTQKRDRRREDSSDEVREGLKAKTPSPSKIAEDKETLAIAARLYESLSPADKQLLTLREALGWSYAEIGADFDITSEAARKRCEAARERLLAKLAAANENTLQ